jgi:TonB family protein
MSCPDPYRPYDPSAEATSSDAELKVRDLMPSDADVRGLVKALAASGGGSSSKDLALDLVLNQIVEQACLATGATGSAIALMRDGEMVCRATTGRNAPDLGVRLDNAGFSAECLRVGTLQRCDDTEADPRVDPTACRLLGVRSILVIPLWYWGEFMGIFEIFSPRPNAFGERDEQTLQALAYRVVRQAKQATGRIAGFAQNEPPAQPETKTVPVAAPRPAPPLERESEPEPEPVRPSRRTPILELKPARSEKHAPNLPMVILAICVGVIASSIVGLMIWRVTWPGSEARKEAPAPETVHASTAPEPVAAPPTPASSASAPQEEILELSSPLGATKPRPVSSAPSKGVVISAAKKSDAGVPPAVGGLAIYDKGKLIYGTPIPDPDRSTTSDQETTNAERAAAKPRLVAKATPPRSLATALDKSRFVPISPDAANDLLTDRIEPDYPDAARRARIQGTVTLDALIGEDGRVREVTPLTGNAVLADAATAAVRKWRYKPYTVKGKRVAVRTQVPVTFMLAQ